MSLFDPKFGDLPDTIPVFPLPEVLLLPGGTLPLNIFEPRYLAMVQASLQSNRMIGMVQPNDEQAGGEQATDDVQSPFPPRSRAQRRIVI